MFGFSKKQLTQIFFLLLGVGVVAGLTVVWLANSFGLSGTASRATLLTSSTDLSFINPTVSANLGKHYIINFKELREQLVSIQEKYLAKTYVYFDFLSNASWVGLHERDMVTAASTIKVPLAMAVFKAVEHGRISFDQTFALRESELDDRFGTLYAEGADKTLTIKQLVERMLQESDNTSMNALFDVLRDIGITDPLAEVYAAMGWDYPAGFGEAPSYAKINLKTLSNVFLALYNATYLSMDDSQQILSYLSRTPFTDKIVAGVPRDVVVTHKIGTYLPENVYSDCGIVYAPGRHYLLCVAMEGADESLAKQFMSSISKVTYDYVITH